MKIRIKFTTSLMLLLLLTLGAVSSAAQNLTAAQMNIYFGQPKKATCTNSQGTTITEFDCEGKVTSVTQGNMRMVYDWEPNGEEVTLSMLQGQNIKDSMTVQISCMTKRMYRYSPGGINEITVTFKKNGALENALMQTPQGNVSMTYLYHNDDDIYPYAIEQSMGNQSMKTSVTVNKCDNYGNAVEYTQELMGVKDVNRVTIEYY